MCVVGCFFVGGCNPYDVLYSTLCCASPFVLFLVTVQYCTELHAGAAVNVMFEIYLNLPHAIF